MTQYPSTIIGRTRELSLLNKIANSSQAEFLAVYGRRRIGKTYLISEYFKNKDYYFELTGIKGASLSTQLKTFRTVFAKVFYSNVKQAMPKTWQDAFEQLCDTIESLDPSKKIILFLDELPWLASRRSDLLPSLEYAWNRYLSRLKNVTLIVCGSAASWMIRKIIYNKGGLYGRLTAEMNLKPFTLSETELYLKWKNINLDRKQIIELYFVFGGVAKYLAHVNPGQSSAQIIADTCFNPGGALNSEFPKLYDSLFDNPEQHLNIIKTLASKKSGMTQDELLEKTKLSSGGRFSKLLTELEDSGLILATTAFSHKKKFAVYRLIDEYSLFYLTWIKPTLEKNLSTIAENYWLSLQNTPSYTTWAGYAFEGICLKHVDKIIEALKISVVARSVSTWSYRPDDKSSETAHPKGTQIDLVIDRADKCINLCEIKFYNKPFKVTPDYADQLRYKKFCFMEHTKTLKSPFITLITSYGAVVNQHYLSSVDNQLTMDVLF